MGVKSYDGLVCGLPENTLPDHKKEEKEE